MFYEYLVVFVIVGAAAWFVGKKLWKQTQGGGCGDCHCASDNSFSRKIIRLEANIKKK